MSEFTKEKWAAFGNKIYAARNGDIGDTVLLAEIKNKAIHEASSIAWYMSFTPEMYRLLELVAFGGGAKTYADIVKEAIKLYDLINGYDALVETTRKEMQ